MGVGVNATPHPLYHQEWPVTTEQKDELAPGPVCMGAENLSPTEIQSLHGPASSKLL